jgi:hypothetical protein
LCFEGRKEAEIESAGLLFEKSGVKRGLIYNASRLWLRFSQTFMPSFHDHDETGVNREFHDAHVGHTLRFGHRLPLLQRVSCG